MKSLNLRILLSLALFVMLITTAFAGGSRFGVTETDVRDKLLVAGESGQVLMSFELDRAEGMMLESLDISCVPSHGFTNLTLMNANVEIDTVVFDEVSETGVQTVHFGASDYAMPAGDLVELSLFVDVEEGTGDFITACAIDDMIFFDPQADSFHSSSSQYLKFSGIDRLVYVDDPTVNDRFEGLTIFNEEGVSEDLGLATVDNVLLEFTVNAASDVEIQDLFISCTNAAVIENVWLEIDGQSVEDIAMHTDWYATSRPEHSSDKRMVFTELAFVAGPGEGIDFTLYGDSYDYFSNPEGVVTSCSVVDVMVVEEEVSQANEEEIVISDLSENHRNREAIEYLYGKGYVNGYDDGTFKPDKDINRAEFLKILVEGVGVSPTASEYSNCFSDVTEDWYVPYVCYAKENGWVDGYPDGSFKPARTVNKVEAIKMLLNSQGVEVPETVSEDPFTDVPRGEWFAQFIDVAKDMGILEETGDFLDPSANMTRGNISENLFRLLTFDGEIVQVVEEDIVYSNGLYGFSVSFPQSWAGYLSTDRTLDWGTLGTSDSIDFGFFDQDSVFNISMHSQSQWQDILLEEGPIPTYLGENNDYVFAYMTAQYVANDDMTARMAEVQEIVETFEVIE